MSTTEQRVQDLKSENDEVRERAAKALMDFPDPAALEALLVALDDRDNMVRRYAAGALGAARDARAVPRLIQQAIKHDDRGSRSMATAALGTIGDGAATATLIALLADTENTIRLNAARALGQIRDRRAVPVLIGALRDPQNGVRGTAIEALGAIGDPAAVQPLVEYYWSTEGDRRSSGKHGWDLAMREWTDRRRIGDLIDFIRMDSSEDRIIQSLARSLELIRETTGEAGGSEPSPGSA